MQHCCKQARERIYIGGCALFLSPLVSPRASGVCLFSMRYHSPRVVILLVSGLREWDVFRVGDFLPRMFTAEPVRRLRGKSAEQFTPHHILEWGAKTAVRTRGWLYELPSGSRNHILELREKHLFYQFSSYMSYATFILT